MVKTASVLYSLIALLFASPTWASKKQEALVQPPKTFLGYGKGLIIENDKQLITSHGIEISGAFDPAYYIWVDFIKKNIAYRYMGPKEYSKFQDYKPEGLIKLSETSYNQIINLTKKVWTSDTPFTEGYPQQQNLFLFFSIRDGSTLKKLAISTVSFSGSARELYDFIYSTLPKKKIFQTIQR